jgi:hypothetical protein
VGFRQIDRDEEEIQVEISRPELLLHLAQDEGRLGELSQGVADPPL